MRRTALCLLLTIFVSACGSGTPDGGDPLDGGNPVGPSGPSNSNTGSLAFSTTASLGWATIDVSISGTYVGTLRRYFDPTPNASCVAVADARIVNTLAPGSYSYSARANNGVSWSGTANVMANGCSEVVFQCGNRDCSR
jgi:hypothetical protein